MIQKQTKIIPIDTAGIGYLNVFHLYVKCLPKTATSGDFIYGSVRTLLKKTEITIKSKIRCCIIHTVFRNVRVDGSSFFFKLNSGLTFRKYLVPLGESLLGPCFFEVKKKKLFVLFLGIL